MSSDPAARNAPGAGPARRFHVGDLLAAVMHAPGASPRGFVGLAVLRCYMAGRPPAPDADFLADCRAYAGDFAAAVLAAYPELGAYADDVPPPLELRALWLRRRAQEFGRYLPAPRLPATHPLRRHRTGGRGCIGPPGTPPPAAGRAPGTDRRLFDTCADPAYAARLPSPPARPAGGAPEPARAPRRRVHVGDLLAIVMDRDVAPRGVAGAVALLRAMAGDSAATPDVLAGYRADFRAAVLAAYPALGTYGAADEPPDELRDVWLRRRALEFGRDAVAPLLPAGHPLRAPAPSAARPAPTPLAEATPTDRASRRSGAARAPAPA
ncbi:hypothetical protein tb265_50290 [Gemmatimonadetes bacterium T265]|nr:hypothetical protein tb265_50290 [Gemmatimonadetes bacterium T265]